MEAQQSQMTISSLCMVEAIRREGNIKKIYDNLVLATFFTRETTHDRQQFSDLDGIIEAIGTYFGVIADKRKVQKSLDELQMAGNIEWDPNSRSYHVSLKKKAEFADRVNCSKELEKKVREKWIKSLPQAEALNEEEQDQLWSCLQVYMAKVFRQHNVQTMQILDPKQEDDTVSLSRLLKEAVEASCDEDIKEIAFSAAPGFFDNPDKERTDYITQLLDGAFTFSALSVDEQVAAYFQKGVNLSIFLDTNFIIGILNFHRNRLNDVSRELVNFVKANKINIKFYYHEATERELKYVIKAAGNRLIGKTWKPSTSQIALESGKFKGIIRAYHEKNAVTPTPPETFLEKYDNIALILEGLGFTIYRVSGTQDAEQHTQMSVSYGTYLTDLAIVTGRTKYNKVDEVIEHDISVWQAVQRIRRNRGTASPLDGGAFFLTVDRAFWKYDRMKLRKQAFGNTVSVVLPQQLLQLLRPLAPSTTENFDKVFVQTFAMPEFRVIEDDYEGLRSEVLAEINIYEDNSMDREIMMSVLRNNVLIHELAGVKRGSPEFREAVRTKILQEAKRYKDEMEQQLREKDSELATERSRADAAEAEGKSIGEQSKIALQKAEAERSAEIERVRLEDAAAAAARENQIRQEYEENQQQKEEEAQDQLGETTSKITNLRVDVAALEEQNKNLKKDLDNQEKERIAYQHRNSLIGSICAAAIVVASLVALIFVEPPAFRVIPMIVCGVASLGLLMVLPWPELRQFPQKRILYVSVALVDLCVSLSLFYSNWFLATVIGFAATITVFLLLPHIWPWLRDHSDKVGLSYAISVMIGCIVSAFVSLLITGVAHPDLIYLGIIGGIFAPFAVGLSNILKR